MVIYNQDMGMEFDTKKCAMLIMKSDKKHWKEEYTGSWHHQTSDD